jgi:hypothetical protein
MKETISNKPVKSPTPAKPVEPASASAKEARALAAKDKAAAARASEARILARDAKRRLREAHRDYEQARGAFRKTRQAAHEAHVAARKALRKARAEAEARRKAALAARIIADPTGQRRRRTFARTVVPLPDQLSRLIAKPAVLSQGGAPATPPSQAGRPGGADETGK